MKSLTKNPMLVIPVWDAMMNGARDYVRANGFTAVHNMPHIAGVSGSCEQFQSTFAIRDSDEYFGKQAFLVQSDQLYLESLTPLFRKVYCEIQSFRREQDVDSRHLAQFTLFEIEHLGYLPELMFYIESIVKSSIREVLKHNTEMYDLDGTTVTRLTSVLDRPFHVMTYTDALNELGLEWGTDLKADHEAAIADKYGPTFLTHYDSLIKFWNMKNNTSTPEVVNSCDLILPFSGESAGASERETKYDVLVKKLKESDMYRLMKEQGVSDEDFDWYLDQHKDTDVAMHSGAGIGMARVAQFILGVVDIRDAVPFVVNRESLI